MLLDDKWFLVCKAPKEKSTTSTGSSQDSTSEGDKCMVEMMEEALRNFGAGSATQGQV